MSNNTGYFMYGWRWQPTPLESKIVDFFTCKGAVFATPYQMIGLGVSFFSSHFRSRYENYQRITRRIKRLVNKACSRVRQVVTVTHYISQRRILMRNQKKMQKWCKRAVLHVPSACAFMVELISHDHRRLGNFAVDGWIFLKSNHFW